MTSLSHQAAEAIMRQIDIITACDSDPRASVALIIAKVTGCDELAKDKERLDLLSRFAEQPIICTWLTFHNSEDMGYSKADKPVSISITAKGPDPTIEGKGDCLRSAIDDAFLSRLQPTKTEER